MSNLKDTNDSRYSRQILSLGKSAHNKLSKSTIRINNLSGGLATEVAKNLVLQGVGCLVLNDTKKINDFDIENGLYFNSKGLFRNKVLQEHLQKLNPSTKIIFNSKKVDLDIYLNMDITGKTNLIYSKVGGCRGFIFNDFGNHLVEDVDGENYDLVVIKDITAEGIITTFENHNLSDNYQITLEKMDGKNMKLFEKFWEISVLKPNKFKLKNFDINDFEFKNGYLKRVKIVEGIEFENIDTQLKNPTLPEDWMNPELPKNQFDYWFNQERKPEDKLELGPVNAFFGGLIASEAIKKVTNVYLPINQWFFWEDISYLNYDDSGENSVEKIVGKHVYNNIKNGKWFLIGSGAIGCEMLKNLGQLNFGSIYITDPDHIEVSNLSRQFLFHKEDINKSKSQVAGEKVKQFNPKMNIISFEDKMCKETENKFNSSFYRKLDGMINALDNYQARLYMDSKAIEYNLPLFESGTQGSKGNTQPVIPQITENYGATSDPPESESYPLCTLKNFPNKPEHIIHYIKEMFNEWMTDFPTKVKLYLSNKNYLNEITDMEQGQLISKMNKYFKHSDDINGQINFWREFYYENFRDNILQILHNYPENHQIDGKSFWSNGKQCPKQLNNYNLVNFIMCSLQISEKLIGKKYTISKEELEKTLNSLEEIPPKNLKKKVAIEEKELKEQELMEKESLKVNVRDINIVDFDKDVECDYEWLYETSKIRAYTYKIELPDILQVRRISGKIIPAMATTTSIVSGLISLEILKYYKNSSLEDYRSYFINLANNNYLFSEPNSPNKNKINEFEFTVWDKFECEKDIMVSDFIERFSKKFNSTISMVVSDEDIIYAPFLTPEENLSMKLSELISDKVKTILCSDNEENEYPQVYLK